MTTRFLICVLVLPFCASPALAQTEPGSTDSAESAVLAAPGESGPISEDSDEVAVDVTAATAADTAAGTVPSVPAGADAAMPEEAPRADAVQPAAAEPITDIATKPETGFAASDTPPAAGPPSGPVIVCTDPMPASGMPPCIIPGESAPADPALAEVEAPMAVPLEILDESIEPGTKRELRWSQGESFGGERADTPLLVAHGSQPGPVLCLTAAVHGDELNGVEIVRRVMNDLRPETLVGTVIGVPIVNIHGFLRATRYLPDRRDLNRYFPGKKRGSAASRIAHLFYEQIVSHCNFLIDLHTGSLSRINLPQLRANLENPAVMEFARNFGATAVLQHSGGKGTLRRAATDAGLPAVTFELGEPGFLQREYIDFGVKAIETALGRLGIASEMLPWDEPQSVYHSSFWVRADRGGILLSDTQLGADVGEGDLIGTITNPLTNEVTEIRSPMTGRILGMALNQFVLPGFATFHIGVPTDMATGLAAAPATEDGASVVDSTGSTEQVPEGMEEDESTSMSEQEYD